MVKICFLADAQSIHTRKWAQYFSGIYNEIHIISMRKTDYVYESNVYVHVLRSISKNKLSYFLLIKDIKKLVKEINPDILHSHYATSYGLYGRMCNFHPFIISVWGSDIYEFPKGNIAKELLLKYILKGADKVCSTSYNMAEETRKYYNEDIIITPFGVDIDKFKCYTPILSSNNITIGVIKGLEKIYGIEYLIEGFSKVIHEYKGSKELKLLIVGDGTQKIKLESLVNELGINSNVTFTGKIDNDKVPEYINMMDIVCLPSLSESFGVSAVEACACGRPILATNVGGLKEIIFDDYNGFIIKQKSSEDIKLKIIKIIRNEVQMMEFSKNARKLVLEKYSWINNAKIMDNLYKKLVNIDK
ncbi:glycosyltransferase [Clostridium estertheticum]|uniref:Glycosyltransferase n=1 Tax=Clostridium estertheticum TaxID=238834 RepID=A0AA47I825_9CLOT|nr:glycosyltransferase [Clostridium estertheticum]MBU3154815.1 glycosyltransferase [Clostridium estertheticum]MBU3198951.1 glycosyltransferase [Clostridium estertheticum]WAG61610.1 glycosyltransferase [Clostridium estertheticum]WAG64260.1 glycosyltransferase [Clostridium estertheticum]